MILYHCSYIHRTGKICGRNNYSPEGCYIHRKSPVRTPCRECSKLNKSKYNACDTHVGKYKSRENYHQKKQAELRAKIAMFENHISDLPNSMHKV